MSAQPLPPNEAQRLAAVHAQQILDTPPETEFDVTTRVAAQLFDAPIALVALMDRDRLWFKSRQGLAAAQLDREIAFCAHAIVRADELMVIEDLQRDPRFAANPLVTGPLGLRFYAGAPLVDEAGHALGTIAVLDTAPRGFGDTERALLKDLSVSVMTALTNRRRALELAALATTDALTGLGNRVRFEAAYATERRQAARADRPVALLYADLDDFKHVNDRFGHAAGDTVLREVAQRLQREVRAGDTLTRLGGDEFAVVMRSGADRAAAQALAERFVEALETPFELAGGATVSVGVSVGVAVSGTPGDNAQGLLDEADHALYQAKSQASRRWHLAGAPGPRAPAAPASGFIELEPVGRPDAAACGACAEGAHAPFPFSMAFQPIVSIARRNVFAYEALVRGTAGEPAPTVLGRVTRRNRYAFDQSCRRTAIELSTRLGLLDTDARLSINFIPGAMYEPENCVRATLAAARRAQMPLDRLIFEVTEGEEVLHPAHLANIFRVYRRHGFMPAIDDFGAGYSGLNLLAEFQPGIIKLDRQLLQAIDGSRPRQAIVRGVLSVCRDLEILPVAEGVETEAEFRTLHAMGIDLFQGYLFARPGFEALPEPVFPAA